MTSSVFATKDKIICFVLHQKMNKIRNRNCETTVQMLESVCALYLWTILIISLYFTCYLQ